ncbi:MAG: type I-U CRISPR-associated protein Cas7 [Verrucomicrobiae bacterium]|nr:type I-U CRISPR-associated protein Cas7 [Verrucomicrobiae bacterium]
MNYENLFSSVQRASGLRLRLRLQPMYGAGEIVFPCTVAGGKYLTAPRRIPGYHESIDCTTLDSVQSQANRMEAVLLEDIRSGNLSLPHIETDFSDVDGLEKPVGKITCFDAPHRVFDAIIRDSVDEKGTHFPFTGSGKAAIDATSRNATALLSLSPSSLLFGSWDSTGVSGGLGEKYARCVVSEIVAVNSKIGGREGVRADPLNSSGDVDCVKIAETEKYDIWKNRQAKTKKDKNRASAINHGNIVWDAHGGVTCDYIQQSITISFPALRQLRFPVEGKDEADTSAKGQAVLAAIALHAAALNVERGWHLRSRCDLVLDDGVVPEWEILGGASSKAALTAGETRKILKKAIEEAKAAGLPWNDEPVRLKPSQALAKLVVASQKAHRESTTEA